MKLALLCAALSITLPLLTLAIYLRTFSQPTTPPLVLPRTCVPLPQDTVPTDFILCYSCIQRDHLSSHASNPIEISSSDSFHYISFTAGTGDYSCDQLLQLLDTQSYIDRQLFQVQELEIIYKTLDVLGAKVSKVSTRNAVLPPLVSSALVLQKIAIVSTQSYYSGLAGSRLKLSLMGVLDSQKLEGAVLAMSLLSGSTIILLILWRQYNDMGCQSLDILRLAIPVCTFLVLKVEPDHSQEILGNHYLDISFLLAIALSNQQFKYFLPCLAFALLTHAWAVPAYCYFLLIYLHSICENKNQSLYWAPKIHQCCSLILFLLARAFKDFDLSQQRAAQRLAVYWVVVLSSPCVEAAFLLISSLTKAGHKKDGEQKHAEEEQIISLSKDSE